ncbi:MAG TPA: RNA methyltransferase [Candidatus Polarisedimenticolaceae bacterium]|nr:RNA methyltransferase [Candidatus Polarisedimenticolaceae bacterium]
MSVRFVLVEPQSAGNLGSAARALKNLGFSALHLVAPRCDPRSLEARALAVDAWDLLDEAKVQDTLDDALQGMRTVVGTSARTGKQRRPHHRLDAFAPDLARLAAAGPLAAVFGREAHGLSDAELDRCTHLVHIAASPDYPSFNLAQAVLLVAYTLRLGLDTAPPPGEEEASADHGSREAMLAHLEDALRAIGYLHEDTAVPMMRRLRRFFGRAELTAGEAAIFRGIARQVLWAAGQAKLTGDTPPRDALDTLDLP